MLDVLALVYVKEHMHVNKMWFAINVYFNVNFSEFRLSEKKLRNDWETKFQATYISPIIYVRNLLKLQDCRRISACLIKLHSLINRIFLFLLIFSAKNRNSSDIHYSYS